MKKLETERLILRKFEIEDAQQAYNNWAGVEKIADMSDFKVHSSVNETREIIQIGLGDEEESATWAIELKENHELAGYIRAYEASITNKTCKISWGIGYKWLGQGISIEAMKSVIEHLIINKDYNVVTYEYYSNMDKINKPILEDIGMKKEAVLKDRKIDEKTGEKLDKIIYSAYKDDYIKK